MLLVDSIAVLQFLFCIFLYITLVTSLLVYSESLLKCLCVYVCVFRGNVFYFRCCAPFLSPKRPFLNVASKN